MKSHQHNLIIELTIMKTIHISIGSHIYLIVDKISMFGSNYIFIISNDQSEKSLLIINILS